MARKEEIQAIAESVTESEGVDLYWVKYQGGKNAQRVQILIDKESGVTHTDCVRVSRALEQLFDQKIDHQYELEVSSPGVERPLLALQHYQRVIGQEIKVKTFAPIDGNKVWSGKLVSVTENSIVIGTPKGQQAIPFDQIAQAHVAPQFDFS